MEIIKKIFMRVISIFLVLITVTGCYSKEDLVVQRKFFKSKALEEWVSDNPFTYESYKMYGYDDEILSNPYISLKNFDCNEIDDIAADLKVFPNIKIVTIYWNDSITMESVNKLLDINDTNIKNPILEIVNYDGSVAQFNEIEWCDRLEFGQTHRDDNNESSRYLYDFDKLTNIKGLWINAYDNFDLNSVAKLSTLDKLIISEVSRDDFSIIGEMTNLKELSMFCMDLEDIDISWVVNLKELTSLYIPGLTLQDYQVIGQLTNLTCLTMSRTNITDISFASNLKNLETFEFDGTAVTDISLLANLPKLKYISIPETVEDTSMISKDVEINYVE